MWICQPIREQLRCSYALSVDLQIQNSQKIICLNFEFWSSWLGLISWVNKVYLTTLAVGDGAPAILHCLALLLLRDVADLVHHVGALHVVHVLAHLLSRGLTGGGACEYTHKSDALYAMFNFCLIRWLEDQYSYNYCGLLWISLFLRKNIFISIHRDLESLMRRNVWSSQCSGLEIKMWSLKLR